ncbi:MAG: hypothetical protein LBJ17_00145 [Dysgonamonadaceae bacterium]|jgi:hypothetical protein|nr:hypothetical protein [Dysgonamonadaceae bacterium]
MNKRNLLLFTVFAIATFSCNDSKKSDKNSESEPVVTSAAENLSVYPLDSLLNMAETQVDKNVTVVGYVTHTCKHSGKRCFMVGESQKGSMRIEAKGEIGGFNRELVGSKIEVTGTVKEHRLTKEYISQMEKDVEMKKEEDGTAESCAAELSNINAMRQWMKDNGKEYYSIFYMDGQNFAVVE